MLYMAKGVNQSALDSLDTSNDWLLNFFYYFYIL